MDLSEFDRRKQPGGKCKFPGILQDLPEEDSDKLAEALVTPTVPHVGIERWLANKGYDHVKYNAVLRHRNGHCACG